MKKKVLSVIFASALAFTTLGCGQPGSVAADTTGETAAAGTGREVSATPAITEAVSVVEVISSGAETAADETLITLSDDDGSVRITEAGAYRLRGVLTNGQIVIDAPDVAQVKLILDGVDVTCEGHAAIYAIGADKLVLSAAENSSNRLASVGDFVQTDENNVDAAVFSKCDLTLSGEGALGVSCECGHGVVSKDDLKVKSGTVSVEAAGQGLSGKDSVTVEDGTISIVSGTDGIHSSHEDTAKGNIEILGGSIYIQSGTDGVDASGTLFLSGGNLTVYAGNSGGQDGGKALKADGDIGITGGVVTASSDDDGIHSNGSVTIRGGELSLSAADDGIHADEELMIQDGIVNVLASYEGLEAQQIAVSGGTIYITASDDGVNAAGGSDGSNAFGPRGGDPFAVDGSASLVVSGGTLTINAGGDGLDSNGELLVSGGTVYISGPTNDGNGALDFGSGATITGGTVIAVGSAGMAENFGSASTQGTILLNVGSQAAGSTVSIRDESGNILASFSPEKSYQSVVVSAPGVQAGGSYTVSAGSFSETVTLTSAVYGGGMGMGGFGGRGTYGGQGFPGGGGSGTGGGPMGGGQGGRR